MSEEPSVNLDDLSSYEPDAQIEIMREWFFENYENPAERTPYETAEGGYIYIYGGPYYAEDVLRVEFEGRVDDEIILELVRELHNESIEWTHTSMYDEIDEYFLESVLANTEAYSTFTIAVEQINVLLLIKVDDNEAQKNLYRLLHVNVISALETYLSDKFINKLASDEKLIRRFVEFNSDFKKQKFSLSELFIRHDTIENEVNEYLLSQIWHNLAKVKNMYKSTFKVSFPSDLDGIFKSISTRHDIVHRNGKSKEGGEVVISLDDVQSLITSVQSFVSDLDSKL